MVGASRSYANVTKSGSQGMIDSVIDVEIYTKKIITNEVQISGGKASPSLKAIVAKELLGLTRQEMQEKQNQLVESPPRGSSSMSQSTFKQSTGAKIF